MKAAISDAERTQNAVRFLEARGYRVQAPQAPQPQELMTIDDVERLTTLKKSTIYRMQKDGDFPVARRLGAKMVRWKRSEIQAWLDRRTA